MGPGVGVGGVGMGPRELGQQSVVEPRAVTTVPLRGLNQHVLSDQTLAPHALRPAAAHSAQQSAGVAAGGWGSAMHSGVPGQMSRLGAYWHAAAPSAAEEGVCAAAPSATEEGVCAEEDAM